MYLKKYGKQPLAQILKKSGAHGELMEIRKKHPGYSGKFLVQSFFIKVKTYSSSSGKVDVKVPVHQPAVHGGSP